MFHRASFGQALLEAEPGMRQHALQIVRHAPGASARDRFRRKLEAPVALAATGKGVFFDSGVTAARWADNELGRVRAGTRRAVTHEAGLPRRSLRGVVAADLQLQKHQLLRADADAIAATEGCASDDRFTAHLDAVSRAQILDHRARALDTDPRVLTRHEG